MTDNELRVGKWSRVTGDDRDRYRIQVVAKYGDGMSIRQIAAEVGRSYGFVHRLLEESHIGFRSRGNPRVPAN